MKSDNGRLTWLDPLLDGRHSKGTKEMLSAGEYIDFFLFFNI
jgi:hypothetical protein